MGEPSALIEFSHRDTTLPQRPSQPCEHRFPVSV